MYALAAQTAEEGLTMMEIVADIPHDFSALVVYLMLGIFIFLLWWGSKSEVIDRYAARYDGDSVLVDDAVEVLAAFGDAPITSSDTPAAMNDIPVLRPQIEQPALGMSPAIST